MLAGLVSWGQAVPATLLPVLLVEGAGIGMVMAPLASSALAGVPLQHAGVGSGVLATMQQVGNSLGVAIVGILFFGVQGGDMRSQVSAPAFALCLGYLAALALLVAGQLNAMLQRAESAV